MSRVPEVVKAACGNCPFRSDVPIYLRPDRRREIVAGLLDGGTFHCHQYVEHAEDDDGEPYASSWGPECAGAVKAMHQADGSTQLTRVAERLGIRDPADYDRGPAVWSLSIWPLVPEGETADSWDSTDAEEIEVCATVGPGCLAPAGYRGAGGAIVRGTEAADGRCVDCDEPLCSACADDDGRCESCAEWAEEDDG